MWPFKFGRTSLPNHDLNNHRVSKTSTAWRHVDCCKWCLNSVGHEEFMTGICLSCGRNGTGVFLNKRGARRRIVWNGRWIVSTLIDGNHYQKLDGVWVKMEADKAGGVEGGRR